MPRALAVFAAVCVHCTIFMQRLQAYAVWMLNVHTHKDDGRTKGIAFHSSFKIDAFLFIKSIAKWYKRVSMRCDVFCLFVCCAGAWFVRWLVGVLPAGHRRHSFSNLIYRYCYLFSTAAIYAHFACSYHHLVLHTHVCDAKRKKQQQKSCTFLKIRLLGAFLFITKCVGYLIRSRCRRHIAYVVHTKSQCKTNEKHFHNHSSLQQQQQPQQQQLFAHSHCE